MHPGLPQPRRCYILIPNYKDLQVLIFKILASGQQRQGIKVKELDCMNTLDGTEGIYQLSKKFPGVYATDLGLPEICEL